MSSGQLPRIPEPRASDPDWFRQMKIWCTDVVRAIARSRLVADNATLREQNGILSAIPDFPSMFHVDQTGPDSISVRAGVASRYEGASVTTYNMTIVGGGTSASPLDGVELTSLENSQWIILTLDQSEGTLIASGTNNLDIPDSVDGTVIPLALVTCDGGKITRILQAHTGPWYLPAPVDPDLKSIDRNESGELQLRKYEDPRGAIIAGSVVKNNPNISLLPIRFGQLDPDEPSEEEPDPADPPEAPVLRWLRISDIGVTIINNEFIEELVDQVIKEQFYFWPESHPHRGKITTEGELDSKDIHLEESFANDDHNPSKSAGAEQTFGYLANTGDAGRNAMDHGLGDAGGNMSVDVAGRQLKSSDGNTRVEWTDWEARLEAGAAKVVANETDDVAKLQNTGSYIEAWPDGAVMGAYDHEVGTNSAVGGLLGDNWRVYSSSVDEYRDLKLRKIITNGANDDAVRMDEGAGITIGENVYKPILIEAEDGQGGGVKTYEVLGRLVE